MTPHRSSIVAYIAPFAAYMALLAVWERLPQPDRVWLYPVQTVICGVLLIWFWSVYPFKVPEKAVLSLFTAILMLVIWISPQLIFHRPGRFDGFDPTVYQSSPPLYAAIVGIRFFRLVVIVPFIEEIFWRGFLLRYMVSDDFETVPLGTFSPLSFWVVTIGFCLEHQYPDWPAAIVAGALFNFIIYRTRSLASCVLVHAVANFLLGLYIMRTGQWGFW